MDKFLSSRKCLSREDIQAYLDASLSEDQRFAVENHLLDCALCDAAVEGFAKVPTEQADHDLAEIRQRLNLDASKPAAAPQPSASIKPLPRRRNWLAAAAAIGFLLLSSILYRQYGPQSSAQVFAQAYENYESPFASSRSNTSADDALNKGLTAYQSNDFALAYNTFEQAIENGDEQFLAHFHGGLSALALEKYSKAQDWLTVARINAPALYTPATWYLALSYLKDNKLERCKDILSQIQTDQKEYYGQAQALLKQLSRVKE